MFKNLKKLPKHYSHLGQMLRFFTHRPQKDPNILLDCKFSQSYKLKGSYFTKNIGILTSLKIMWVDHHVPTINLVYGNNFWTLYGSLTLNRHQKGPNMVITTIHHIFSILYERRLSAKPFIPCYKRLFLTDISL